MVITYKLQKIQKSILDWKIWMEEYPDLIHVLYNII